MKNRLSREYRRDREMYVDDQCCSNCGIKNSWGCPMHVDEFDDCQSDRDAMVEMIVASEEDYMEDVIFRDGEPQWCIYWEPQGHSGHQSHSGYQSHRGHQEYGNHHGYQNRRAQY